MTQYYYETTIIDQSDIDGDLTELVCKHNEEIICIARFNVRPDCIYLRWIETYDKYKGKGVASAVINYIANQAESKYITLVIKAVDENTINNFYYKWFKSRFDIHASNNLDTNEIKDKFNSLVNDDLEITLLPDDLTWQPLKEDKGFSFF